MAPAGPHLRPLLLLLVLHSCCSLPRGAVAQGLPALSSYPRSAELQEGSVYLYWRVNESDSSIHFAMQARTSGWLALGISEVGAMVGSDVMLGWVANGSAVMTDRFIFNRSQDASGVALDSQQDVRIVAGQESYNATTGDTWTTLHFWRLLNTSDCNDRPIRAGEHVALIWALGTTDDPSYHGVSRGGKTVVLYPGALFASSGRQVPATALTVAGSSSSSASTSKAAAVSGRQLTRKTLPARHLQTASGGPAPPPSKTNPGTLVATDEWMNLTATNFIVPTNFTSYICNTFNITAYQDKKHSVEFGIILNSTHPETIHHTVVWACLDTDTPQSYDPNFPCYSQGGCSLYFAVWAVGGNPTVFPPAAGMPVGAGGYKKLILQMHYTNPQGLDDIVDNSGMYFKISPKLRPYDAGVLETGPVYFTKFINIPARQPVWTQDTICPSECSQRLANTSDGADRTNITVFASFMHLHELGKQLYVDLYRGGQKMLSAGRQDYYDFNYQQTKDLSPGFYVLPGDELRTRCVYDSSNRTTTTVGGFSTTEEMCIGYLFYYPIRISYVGPCFNFCAPPNNTTTTLVPMASCAGSVIPINGTCPATFEGNFGTNTTAFSAEHGCPANLAPSLSALDVSSLSVPVPAAGEAPSAPPASTCVASTATGQQLTYSQCTTLDGGFSLMWTTTSDEDSSSSGTASKISADPSASNVTLVMRFSGTSPGYIAFGFSPSGGMIGSSAVAGWLSSSGRPNVQPLYLGGYAPSLLTKGNNLKILGSKLETSAGPTVGSSVVTIYVNISVPASTATTAQNMVWSKGNVVNDFVSQHQASDAHKGVLTPLDCSSSAGAADCSALGLVTSAPPPPPPSKGALHLPLAPVLTMSAWVILALCLL